MTGVATVRAPHVNAPRKTVHLDRRTIGAIVPELANNFRIDVLASAQRRLAADGYSLVICPARRAADHIFAWAAEFDPRTGGLLIVQASTDPYSFGALNELGVPAVLVNAHDAGTSSVVVDHVAGLNAAVSHLVSLGHRRIAFIDDRDGLLACAGPAACRRVHSTVGVRLSASHEREAYGEPPATAAVICQWLELPEAPTAVVAGTDRHAITIMDAVRSTGRRVPEDLAVIVFGDTALTAHFGLTAVRLPLPKVGERAAALLLEAMANPDAAPVHICMAPELVVRATSGAHRLAACGLSTQSMAAVV